MVDIELAAPPEVWCHSRLDEIMISTIPQLPAEEWKAQHKQIHAEDNFK